MIKNGRVLLILLIITIAICIAVTIAIAITVIVTISILQPRHINSIKYKREFVYFTVINEFVNRKRIQISEAIDSF